MKRTILPLAVVVTLIVGWIIFSPKFSKSPRPGETLASLPSTGGITDREKTQILPPVALASEDAELNQRTRPQPRPPDIKHPAPATPVAVQVPGSPGMIFSPYNDKIIDVGNIPSGTLVQDPTYPAEEKRYFRVP